MPNFATLSQVKSWLNLTSSVDDALLTTLINQISVAILEYLQRPDFIRTTFTELQSGVGNQRMVLRNWPVISVSSLIADQTPIPAAPTFGQVGYTIEQWDGTSSGKNQVLTLAGYIFPRRQNNIQIIYQAGYCVQQEAQTVTDVMSVYTVTANQTYGSWSQDDGVTYAATGIKLIPVASSPMTGQYTVSNGVYTFSVGDNAASLLINYSFIPAPITQACIEWVSERYRYKSRIGQTSQSLSGAVTSAYSLKIPDHIVMMLTPYKKWMPL